MSLRTVLWQRKVTAGAARTGALPHGCAIIWRSGGVLRFWARVTDAVCAPAGLLTPRDCCTFRIVWDIRRCSRMPERICRSMRYIGIASFINASDKEGAGKTTFMSEVAAIFAVALRCLIQEPEPAEKAQKTQGNRNKSSNSRNTAARWRGHEQSRDPHPVITTR